MALYAGMSVGVVHQRASAEHITREIARGFFPL